MSDIQRLKDHVGDQAENIIARALGLEKTGGKYRCSNAAAHAHGDRNPSMGWHQAAHQFKCFTCDEKIDIYELHCREGMEHKDILALYGINPDASGGNGRKQYPQTTKVPQSTTGFTLEPLTTEGREYLRARQLHDETIDHFGIGSYQGRIAFPYYEQGRVVGVKHRKPGKVTPDEPKYLSAPGSHFGLFNKQNIDTQQTTLIICEGEIDCMVMHQCGHPNTVSVGTGANAVGQLLQEESRFLEQFLALIIVSDNDDAGREMDRRFIEHFGYRAKIVDKSLMTENDVNGEYYRYGDNVIRILVQSAMAKIEGLRDLDHAPYRGVSAIRGRYIATGLGQVDVALNDLAPQCVTLVTGRSNGGKSTFVNQVMANAIDTGNKVLLVNGEGSQELLINKFYQAVIGRDELYYKWRRVNKRNIKEPTKEALRLLQSWHRGKFRLFNKGDSALKTTSELFDMLALELKTEGINLVIIDNLMSVLSVDSADEKLHAQADFMQRCCDLAKCENSHIILVLHPNKSLMKASQMEFEQISGTQDLPNKADNIIAVRREYDDSTRTSGVHGEIAVLKNRYYPDLPVVPIHYEEATGLLLEVKEGQYVAYNFRWREQRDESDSPMAMPV